LKKFTIVSKDDAESIRTARNVQRFLFNSGLSYADKDPDLVCVVGGDGTFLSAIHKYINQLDKVMFTGINTGTLGFFADYTHEELSLYLDDIISKTPVIETKKLLQITVNGNRIKHYLAVNEARIENVIKAQSIDVYINNRKLETFKGNGLCISSQTGSTAYNRSLNGAVVESGLEILELTEVTGIHHSMYHSLGSPLILSGKNVIKMFGNFDATTLLCFDRFAINLLGATSVEVTLADQKIRLAHFRPIDYVQHLYHLF